MKFIKWGLISVAILALLVSAGTFVYINVIEGDPPEKLTFGDTVDRQEQVTTSSVSPPVTALSDVSGAWKATTDSQVGYRVKENLFGQSSEAVGRTNQITGSLVINGTTVSTAQLTVDMNSIDSDQDRRDSQFRGRIMDTTRFPTATYTLTVPITLDALPTANPITVPVTGDLTLRGVTKPVTTSLKVRLNGSNVEVNGTIPVVFGEWSIPNPSFGGVSTEDHGDLELLVVFSKSAP